MDRAGLVVVLWKYFWKSLITPSIRRSCHMHKHTYLPLYPAAMGGISIHREKVERQQAEVQNSCSVTYNQGSFVTIKLSSPGSQDPGFILV